MRGRSDSACDRRLGSALLSKDSAAARAALRGHDGVRLLHCVCARITFYARKRTGPAVVAGYAPPAPDLSTPVLHEMYGRMICPKDGELPDEVAQKVQELNEAIRRAPTVRWYPGKQRIDAEPLWQQLSQASVPPRTTV